MLPLMLPITLTTASVLALLSLFLAVRVVQSRVKSHTPMGDGGKTDMVMRMRTHANFIEYVPLLLILMGLLELGGANKTVLSWAGGALILFRVLHAVGMPRPVPNFPRGAGAMGTFILVAGAAIYGLVLAFGVH